MKKALAMIGLLMAFSQPVFAQCNSCYPYNPCLTGAACPVSTCNPCLAPTITIVPIAKTCVQACAPAQCNPCDPCATGAAAPVAVSTFAVDPEYQYCCPRNGFWRNFFGF